MSWFSLDRRGNVLTEVSLDLPVGFTMPVAFAATEIPDGWLLCDGSAVTAAAWPELNAFLIAEGSPFGVSGPSPLLPDMRGRKPVGKGTHADVAAVGDSDAIAVASRTPHHAHNVPGHTHTVPSHSHPYASHQHASPSHVHASEPHTHDSASHGHTVSGTTDAASGGLAEVAFGTPGVDRICFEAHAHAAGGLGGNATAPGQTGSGGGEATGGPVGQQFGGLTGASATLSTGTNSDSLSASAAADSSTNPVPYQTAYFMMKAAS